MLQNIPYKIIHRKGKFHCLPDALSRSYDVELIDSIDEALLNTVNIKDFTNTLDEWYINARKSSETEKTESLSNADIKFIVIDDILYLNKPKGDKFEHQDLKICVPEEFRHFILHEAHDSKESCHQGFWRMLQRISITYFWPNMTNDINAYVRKCEVCKVSIPSNQNTKVPLGNYRDPKQAWRQISCDFMGPFIKSHKRNEHLCVVVDNFSKFVIMKAMPSANSANLIKFHEEQVFSVFGMPESFISDNGSVYTSKLFTDYLKALGVKHKLLAVYNPKANNTECVNKVIGNAIRAYVRDRSDHRCWDEDLTFIQRSINSSVHTNTTKFSPYFINFGNNMKTNGNDHSTVPNTDNECTNDDRNAKLAVVHEKVQENLYKQFTLSK